MRDQEWDSALAQLNALDFAKLVFCLFCLNSVNGEATLGIVDETEVFVGLVNGDDIHEAGWVAVARHTLFALLSQLANLLQLLIRKLEVPGIKVLLCILDLFRARVPIDFFDTIRECFA